MTELFSINSFIIFFSLATLGLMGLALRRRYSRDQALKKGQEGQFFSSHKGPIFYQVYGDQGPLVVLVHGLGASQTCWRQLILPLSGKARVLTYDLWGFGQSSKELDGPMGLDDQVQVLRDLLSHLHISSIYLVGHSMGGEIAMWFAHEHPRQVKRLIALAPAIDPSLVSNTLKRMTWLAHWTRWLVTKKLIRQTLKFLLVEPHKVSRSMVEAYYSPYREPAAHLCFAAALDIIRDQRVYEGVERISVPVLLLWGERDKVVPLSLMERLLKRLPKAHAKTHPQAGHMPMEDQPLWVADSILNEIFSDSYL